MQNYSICADIVQNIKLIREHAHNAMGFLDLSVGSAVSFLNSTAITKSIDEQLCSNNFGSDSFKKSETVVQTDLVKPKEKKASFVKYFMKFFSSNRKAREVSRSETESNRSSQSAAKSKLAKKLTFNSADSSLTQHCITNNNIDLGAVLARIFFAERRFVEALESLTPTIIGVELFVGGKSGSKDGISELGKLYFLRGKIQLEACKSSSNVSYPFEVGSSRLFAAIQYLCGDQLKRKQEKNSTVRRFARQAAELSSHRGGPLDKTPSSSYDNSSIGKDKSTQSMGSSLNFLTCKRQICYSSPSDLLWDAMKWFRRAWDLFHVAGDEISAAMSANYISKCHLEPTFVPHVFFQIPLAMACNLSSFVADGHRSSSKQYTDSANLNYIPVSPSNSPLSPSDGAFPKMVTRFASLEEVQRVNKFALETSVECSHPLMLIDSYLNIAELCILQGSFNIIVIFYYCYYYHCNCHHNYLLLLLLILEFV